MASYDNMIIDFAKHIKSALNNGITIANQAPVANAGSNVSLTLPTNSVVLQGSGTDADGIIAGYSWRQSSGPNAAAFSSASVARPTVSGLVAGSYGFSLTVKDNVGATSPAALVTVTVNPAPLLSQEVTGQQVVSFTLVNAETNKDILTIASGSTLDLATLPTKKLNIRANTNPATVGSVSLVLSGAQSRNQKENTAPYALFSDASGIYNAWTPSLGSYTLKATPYTSTNFGGTVGAALSISFKVTGPATANQAPVANAGSSVSLTLPTNSVVLQGSGTDADGSIEGYSWRQSSGPNAAAFSSASVARPTVSGLVAGSYGFSLTVKDNVGATSPAALVTVTVNPAPLLSQKVTGQQVVSFTLVNAETNKDILTIASGSTLDLATLPTKKLNIRANTNPATVGSVSLVLNGAHSRRQKENAAPYALFSDASGNYTAWTPALGSYTLNATPYTSTNFGGTAGAALSISFKVINGATTSGSTSSSTNATVSGALDQDRTLIYPNPASSSLFIELNDAGEGITVINFYDLTGRLVLNQEVENASNAISTSLDLGDLNRGTYLVVIDSPKGRITKRILVAN